MRFKLNLKLKQKTELNLFLWGISESLWFYKAWQNDIFKNLFFLWFRLWNQFTQFEVNFFLCCTNSRLPELTKPKWKTWMIAALRQHFLDSFKWFSVIPENKIARQPAQNMFLQKFYILFLFCIQKHLSSVTCN